MRFLLLAAAQRGAAPLASFLHRPNALFRRHVLREAEIFAVCLPFLSLGPRLCSNQQETLFLLLIACLQICLPKKKP